MKKLKIFIKGETINLSKPTLEFAKKSNWYSWLNNKIITKHLDDIPKRQKNTPAKQVKFFLSERKKRFMLIISTKSNIYKGIISLSNINRTNNSCELALITDTSIEPHLAPYAALEAVAKITEYAFKNLGIKKITGDGKVVLKLWRQRMELLGYKFITITNDNYMYKKKLPPSYISSCHYEDYEKIIKRRGHYWDNLKNMKRRISKLPKENFADIYLKFLKNHKNKYYEKIFKILK